MTDPSNGGLLYQQRILNHLELLTVAINEAKLLIASLKTDKNLTGQITRSLQNLAKLNALLDSESKYFFELSNSQYLMLKDNLTYIKQLEQELMELKS